MATKSMMEKLKRRPKFGIRHRNRCPLCGRPRAYLRRFDMCRLCFRKAASFGKIPGVKKASW
ncbi:MAG: type Z 30S ribosomal protein S14 [Candidatus Dadabacteria bacterium]|nr:type Z 30S ribosomal protein S14 [Candidatus Dadabacteria bacterium]